LPTHLDPGGKVVAPGDLSFASLHLAGADLGRVLGADQHSAGRCRGFGETGKDLDAEPTAGERSNPIEAALVEVDGRAAAVDPNRFLGQGVLRDFEDDRAFGEKNHRAVGVRITAVGDGIEAQRRVLVEPHDVGVGKDDLHSRLTGRVHAIAAYQRHVDDGLEVFVTAKRLHGGKTLEVGYVAQRGHLVLSRGHRDSAECEKKPRDQDLFHGPPPGRPQKVQMRCQYKKNFEFRNSDFEFIGNCSQPPGVGGRQFRNPKFEISRATPASASSSR
jgi:hypothetical protein